MAVLRTCILGSFVTQQWLANLRLGVGPGSPHPTAVFVVDLGLNKLSLLPVQCRGLCNTGRQAKMEG